MGTKLQALIRSRRFWIAAAGLIVVVAKDTMGLALDPTQIVAVAGIVIAWITGDTFRKTE